MHGRYASAQIQALQVAALPPAFFAAAWNADARLHVSWIFASPCWVNLIVLIKVAIDNSPVHDELVNRHTWLHISSHNAD
jgi:hypothetical protein